MGITSKEVADRCGVSRITVDRALNGRSGVGEGKRAFILAEAAKMGYRPHYVARSLVKGKTATIGVLVFDLINPFFSEVTQAIEKTAQANEYVPYIMLTENDPDKEKVLVDMLVSRQVDGLLLYTVRKDPEYIAYLRALNIPVLTMMNRLSDDFPFIGIDDARAMADLVNYVLSKGYRRVFYVSPPLRHRETQNIYTLNNRLRGLMDALNDAGGGVELTVLDVKNYAQVLGNVTDFRQVKSAVLCSSDMYAIEVQNLMRKRGLRVPLDVGVAGFDNIHFLRYLEPTLTTLAIPIEEMGETAVRMLLARINGKEVPGNTLLPYEVVLGQSIV